MPPPAAADLTVFITSRDASLTRRAWAHSTLSAVVLGWSHARKRYERQGLLVESAALDQAETDCLSDADARARRREREAERRAEIDRDYLARFGNRARQMFPGAPPEREHDIAGHACRKYTGRVGRSAAENASPSTDAWSVAAPASTSARFATHARPGSPSTASAASTAPSVSRTRCSRSTPFSGPTSTPTATRPSSPSTRSARAFLNCSRP